MEIDYRSSNIDINVVYLSSYLGKGEASGHRCDRTCQVEHVCANLYCCRSNNVTHVCDKNCNQRILYDNHSSLCRVSRKVFPLSSGEQEAIQGVRRKREIDGCESYSFKRRRDARFNSSPTFPTPCQMAIQRPGWVGESFMDIN